MMEAVSLSKRLQTVADMVTGRRVADIGCDHGFVSIYLVQAKKRIMYWLQMSDRGLCRGHSSISKRYSLRRT